MFPLRHYLYPGDVDWTGEGHRFAWRMKLHTRKGKSLFEVRDSATGRTWNVRTGKYLTRKQNQKMSARPDMILQFAHYLAERWRVDYDIPDVEVYAPGRRSATWL